MPMPKPHDDESHDDWMSRCMGDAMMNGEFTDAGQRTAVCSTIWEDAHKAAPAPASARKLKFFDCRFDIKAVDESGAFSGYAAVFNNKDRGGDIVRPGAFKEFEANEDGKIVVLWQHQSDEPIGVAGVAQNAAGLAFDGQLVVDDPVARKARAHMRAKSVRGMSIGYDVLDGGWKYLEDGTRELTALKLWEISLVTFPMNPLAGVMDAKASIERCRSVRELEDLLREAAGLSRAQAKLHAGAIWKTVTGQRDADGEVVRDEVRRTAEAIASLGKTLNV